LDILHNSIFYIQIYIHTRTHTQVLYHMYFKYIHTAM